MSRLSELQTRRQQLLQRCAQQRLELSQRAAPFRPLLGLVGAVDRESGGRHPLAWLVTLAGLVLLGRGAGALQAVRLARRAFRLAARTTFVLRLLRGLRGRRVDVRKA